MINYRPLTSEDSKKLEKFRTKYEVNRVTCFQSKENLYGVEVLTKTGVIRGFGQSIKKAFKSLRTTYKHNMELVKK